LTPGKCNWSPLIDRLLTEALRGAVASDCSALGLHPVVDAGAPEGARAALDGPLAGSVAPTVVRRRISRNREAAA